MCGICGKLTKESICTKCKIKLMQNANFKIENYSQNSSYFDEHMYIFQYSGQIRNSILNYKFKEQAYIYKTFVNFLKNNQKMCIQIKKYDIIVPIPISKKRMKQRGFNQSALIAKSIAKMLKIDYDDKNIIKIKENKKQSELNKEERYKNVQGVYKILNGKKFQQKKILLIDDIFTTGNTVNECSRLLKNEDARKIGIFTIAKD